MKIALFSDAHGHLRIALHMIRNWQLAHQTLQRRDMHVLIEGEFSKEKIAHLANGAIRVLEWEAT